MLIISNVFFTSIILFNSGPFFFNISSSLFNVCFNLFFSLVLVLWLVMMAHEYTAWRCCTPSLGTDSKRQALEVAEKLLTELF